ncbi:TIR domain-containing adapter molecule 2 [Discoglossus pictus]
MMGISHSHSVHSKHVCRSKIWQQSTMELSNSDEDFMSNPEVKSSEEVPEDSETHENEAYRGTEDVFYKFVILHATADIIEALRIKDMLQDELHIKPGIIFAEMPAGQHILKNLEDAINGSAWTIILLTENFLNETWCEFQSHTTLINSINMLHKYNSVIPVRPEKNYLPREKTPFVLKAINALEERNPTFAHQVKKTFQESTYQKQFAIWKADRALME